MRTIQGKILTFSTDKYKIEDGLVIWWDLIKEETKRFAVANCEISENKKMELKNEDE